MDQNEFINAKFSDYDENEKFRKEAHEAKIRESSVSSKDLLDEETKANAIG